MRLLDSASRKTNVNSPLVGGGMKHSFATAPRVHFQWTLQPSFLLFSSVPFVFICSFWPHKPTPASSEGIFKNSHELGYCLRKIESARMIPLLVHPRLLMSSVGFPIVLLFCDAFPCSFLQILRNLMKFFSTFSSTCPFWMSKVWVLTSRKTKFSSGNRKTKTFSKQATNQSRAAFPFLFCWVSHTAY